MRNDPSSFDPVATGNRLSCLAVVAWLSVTVSNSLMAADQDQDIAPIREQHVRVAMRDGVKLSVWLYLPPGKGPWPVLLEQRYSNVHSARKHYSVLSKSGYAVAGANFRGTAQSEGTFAGYHDLTWGEKRDGYDLVEWAASQSWSNGKIGTFGGSQAGFAQNFLAVTQPPHLVCQYMTDTGLSLFHDGYRMGGASRYVQFRAMDAACRVPDHNRRLIAEWADLHPTYDDYWKQEDSGLHFDKMNVPCFTLASWLDDPKGDSSIRSFLGRQGQGGPNSRGKQQMILGPWPHGGFKNNVVGDLTFPANASVHGTGPDGRAWLDQHMLRWFDHYLKGVDNGVSREPAIRYYVMGATGEAQAPGNIWRSTEKFPPASDSRDYFLASDGKLTTEIAESDTSATQYVSDPLHPAKMPDLVSRDLQKYEQDPGVRTFTTPPLSAPVEWTGRVDVELYVSSTARDTDFIVKVCDVYPDGRSIALINSIMRARYRDGFEKEVLLKPGEVAKLKFDIGWTSQIFNRGHRIRIDVASTGAPYYEPNPQTGEKITADPPTRILTATNCLHHSKKFPSRVIAPIPRPAK